MVRSGAAGSLVARYRLTERLGEGAMGAVWKATDIESGDEVAVKLLDARGPRADEALKRFEREARASAAVRHRHVVEIRDFGSTKDGQPYLVMELLKGENLGERLAREPPLTVSALLQNCFQALNGLSAVHYAGIVHRDLKPENIYLADTDTGVITKILDFGLSRILGEGGSGVRPGSGIVGTFGYMAPEQARGLPDVDARADIYAIGVILYEAIAGDLPFKSENAGDYLLSVMSDTPKSVAAEIAELAPIAAVIEKAMSREREARHRNAQELRLALIEALDQTPAASLMRLPRSHRSRESLPPGKRPSASRPVAPISTLPPKEVNVDLGPMKTKTDGQALVIEDDLELSDPFASNEFLLGGAQGAPKPSTPKGSMPELAPPPAPSEWAPTTATLGAPVLEATPAPPAKRRTWLVGLAAGLAVVTIATGGIVVLGSGGEQPAARVQTPRPTASGEPRTERDDPARPSEPAAPTEVVVRLAGLIPEATVSLDGTRVEGAEVRMPADGRTRMLEVVAPGYVPWRLGHVALRDGEYTVAMEPLPTKRRRRVRETQEGLLDDPGF